MSFCISDIIDAIINFLFAHWVNIAITLGCGLILTSYYWGRWVYSLLYPVKIEILGHAHCIYNYGMRGYIIEVDGVRIHFRRPAVFFERYIKIEGSNICYSSLDNYKYIDKTDIYNMRFIPEIYDEVEMATSPLSNETVKGRIFIGKHKSAPFRIVRIFTEKDIVFKRELGKHSPPLANGENEETIRKSFNEDSKSA